MPTDTPHDLLREAAAGPVAPLDHGDLRRRARRRTGARRLAGAALVLAVAAAAGLAVQGLTGPRVDVVESPSATADPEPALVGLPSFPVTLDLPPVGGVAAVHLGERPVFVVHEDVGHVRVLDGISPHPGGIDPPKVLAVCWDPWTFLSADEQIAIATPGTVVDLWHASRFALDGSWLGGPSPTGLAGYEVLSVDGSTVEVGPPADAPSRTAGRYLDRLGDDVVARSGGKGIDCTTVLDRTVRDPRGPDVTQVLWHAPAHPDLWTYPFGPDEEPPSAVGPRDLEPLVQGEVDGATRAGRGAPVQAVVVTVLFVAVVAALGLWLRRRERDGSLDPGRSSVSRPGLRRFFDFGPGGWSRDGRNQPPKG